MTDWICGLPTWLAVAICSILGLLGFLIVFIVLVAVCIGICYAINWLWQKYGPTHWRVGYWADKVFTVILIAFLIVLVVAFIIMCGAKLRESICHAETLSVQVEWRTDKELCEKIDSVGAIVNSVTIDTAYGDWQLFDNPDDSIFLGWGITQSMDNSYFQSRSYQSSKMLGIWHYRQITITFNKKPRLRHIIGIVENTAYPESTWVIDPYVDSVWIGPNYKPKCYWKINYIHKGRIYYQTEESVK